MQKSRMQATHYIFDHFSDMNFFFMAVAGGIIHFTFSLRVLDSFLFPTVIGAVEATMDGDICVLVPAGHLSRHIPRQVGLRVLL
jgi:hypothetical protein